MRLVWAAVRAIPPQTLMALAERGGLLWYRLSRERREITLENLRLVFPEMTPKERISLAKRSFESLARTAAESAIGESLIGSRGAYARRATLSGDWSQLLGEVRAGRGGIIIAAHFGSWELGARWLGRLGVPYRAIMRTLDHPMLNELAIELRGGEDSVIAKKGAMRGAVRALKRREWVVILSDQNAGRHGAFAPFFGIEACTFTTPATLAFRYGVPVFVIATVRSRRKPVRFEFFTERLSVAPGKESKESIERFLTDMNATVERFVRMRPDQYNWCHRRFKTRPPGAVPGPTEPSYGRFARPSAKPDSSPGKAT